MRHGPGVEHESDGFLRPYRVAATALPVFGMLCLLIELQSSSLILWTGEKVPGTNDGGIAYYTVDGEQRTLDAAGRPPERPVPVTVYADAQDSSRDRLSGPAKWFDATFVLAPFLATGVVLGVGLVRRRKFRRRMARHGTPPELWERGRTSAISFHPSRRRSR